ncbi:MAG: ATP-binding protein [Burkholderiaceae bacterium]|nr:ATP-binding protein [Burkholderiaceae bacterium]MCD8515959.1 ATP-binding protein [Burkholderiaceae bacterium]MCD8536991.1 ATP-binding protein [Burkholderiaceae bacterium]MCD8564730.1 ATP-binding protein [Burkholderiaceae bacterium]
MAPFDQGTQFPRFAEPRLAQALAYSPVVLVHGPRQCGKSTLAKMLGDRQGYGYLSFDNAVTRRSADEDPLGFVDDLPSRVILDEVQRVPALFTTLKSVVDRDRQPGRFLLTGSSNVLLVPKLSDSLAGRMAILRLHPFAQCELAGQPSEFLDRLFEADFPVKTVPRLKEDLLERVVAGGYPPALERPAGPPAHTTRDDWYRDYITSLVQRDVREISRIRSLDALPRLLRLAAARTGQLVNLLDLSTSFQQSRQTIGDYITLLEHIFLLERLPPWYNNHTSRLIKTPKLHLGDSGLACSLLGVDAQTLKSDRSQFGPLLETFVYQEIRRMASWHERHHEFFHYRDKDQAEVDIVIERGSNRIAGVEVKAAATVSAADFKGLKKLKTACGDRFAGGVVLYDGETSAGFGEGLYAIPLRWLWEAP